MLQLKPEKQVCVYVLYAHRNKTDLRVLKKKSSTWVFTILIAFL